MKKLIFASVALCSPFFSGCATQTGYGSNGLAIQNYTANSYNNGLRAQRVELGTVLAIHEAQLHQQAGQNAGAGVGAIAGGVLASSLGSGTGKTLASLAGAVAGGLAGGVIGGAATDQNGQIITVQTQSGQVLAVTQDLKTQFKIGERVQVIDDGFNQRIIPL